MSNIWLKIQGVKGPPSHGGEWFEVVWINLNGLNQKLPVSMAIPLDATSQQLYDLSANGTRLEKITVLVQPQTELYFYECDLRDLHAYRVDGNDSLRFVIQYERRGLKYSG